MLNVYRNRRRGTVEEVWAIFGGICFSVESYWRCPGWFCGRLLGFHVGSHCSASMLSTDDKLRLASSLLYLDMHIKQGLCNRAKILGSGGWIRSSQFQAFRWWGAGEKLTREKKERRPGWKRGRNVFPRSRPSLPSFFPSFLAYHLTHSLPTI